MKESDLIIIGCAKTKLNTDERVPAEQLYTSSLFSKRRKYAIETGKKWRILSANYGIIHPEELIPPYDTTIAMLSHKNREALIHLMGRQLREMELNQNSIIELHAGSDYASILRDSATGFEIRLPLQGLGIGQQLAWYQKRSASLTESILWIDVNDRVPDFDSLVMIFSPKESEPVWVGYLDQVDEEAGSFWVFADGSTPDSPVTHWAELPSGPGGAS